MLQVCILHSQSKHIINNTIGANSGVELPNIYEYIVTKVDDSLQGKELATLNNGTVINVPSFVKVGQKIKVNTLEATYVGRADEQKCFFILI